MIQFEPFTKVPLLSYVYQYNKRTYMAVFFSGHNAYTLTVSLSVDEQYLFTKNKGWITELLNLDYDDSLLTWNEIIDIVCFETL